MVFLFGPFELLGNSLTALAIFIAAGTAAGYAYSKLYSGAGTRPVPHLIFDCDGVLVDSEPLSMRVDVEILAENGILDERGGSACALRRQDLRIHAG